MLESRVRRCSQTGTSTLIYLLIYRGLIVACTQSEWVARPISGEAGPNHSADGTYVVPPMREPKSSKVGEAALDLAKVVDGK
jgi:hypothetical protein